MTTKTTPKAIQQTLIDDEDLSADLADLVPVASRITDAAATYIAKLDKKYGDDSIHGGTMLVLDKTQMLAQEAVRIGAAIGKLLRNPRKSLDQLRANETKITVTAGGQTATATPSELEDAIDHA